MKNKHIVVLGALIIGALLLTMALGHDYILYGLYSSPFRFARLGCVQIAEHLAASRTGVRLAVRDLGYGRSIYTINNCFGILSRAEDRDYAITLLQAVLSEEGVTDGRRAHALRLLWEVSGDPHYLLELCRLTKEPVPREQYATPAARAREDMLLCLSRISLGGVPRFFWEPLNVTPGEILAAATDGPPTSAMPGKNSSD